MSEPDTFEPFEAMMRAESLPAEAVETFRQQYAALRSGSTGLLSRAEIDPVSDVPDAETLEGHREAGVRALDRCVVLKLNGGLGTSIGPIFGVVFIRVLQQMLTVWLVPLLETSFTMFPAGFATGVTPMLFGLVIILFLIREPRGLAHRWALLKSAYRLWPFSY